MTVQVCGISDFSLVVFEILMKQIEKNLLDYVQRSLNASTDCYRSFTYR
jgi:hypothetical protein